MGTGEMKEPMGDREWVRRFAEALGVPPPTEAQFDAILTLAGAAAHASRRTAAPVSCWLAGRAGVALEDALRIALDVVADG